MGLRRKIRDRLHNNVLLYVIVLADVLSGSRAHLLPQALEDVHAFVQSELQQRSQGKEAGLGINGPPAGGPQFQTTTYVGTPIVIQKEVLLNDKNGGGLQKIVEDMSGAQPQAAERSVTVSYGEDLARGLVPPSLQAETMQASASSLDQPIIVPANLVGPSTFVIDAPGAPSKPTVLPGRNDQVRGDRASKTMEGWVPLDGEGTQAAKGLGMRVVGDEDSQETRSSKPNENDLDTTIQLNDLVIGTKDLSGAGGRKVTAKYPVYPGNPGKTPKVVIHAQNVIIRNDGVSNAEGASSNGSNIRQFPAYGMVPQLNHFLRDQLRLAAMNQLLQSHPLNGQKFPRPLSLREIAQASRNGQFPKDFAQDPLLQQASSLLSPQLISFTVPHFVKMSRPPQDPLALSSIQSQTKLAFPGLGALGNLYRNIFQEPQGEHEDPRAPLDYSVMAALAGQRLKVPNVPTFKSKPQGQFTSDYGDSVAYTAGKDEATLGDKDPIQIVSAEPTNEDDQSKVNYPTGSLRQMSEELLKQMIMEELEGRGPRRPFNKPVRPPPYGSNSHPFAFLSNPDSAYEESYEFGTGLPSGGGSYSANMFGPPPSYDSLGYGGSEAVPSSKDLLMQIGKGLFSSALDFSKKHNPMTFISKVRSMPPVKFEFYRTPVGIPDSIMDKFPGKTRDGPSGPGGPPPPPHGGRRPRRKHLPRKSNPRPY